MEYKFASRMDRMKASEIRELLKLTARPEIISFAGGLPAPELFPVKEIAQVSHDLVLKEGQKLLQYATTEGRPTLREKIAKRMTEKYKTPVVADDILITTGSQQCLDFAGKLFLDPGDVVLCESPSYLGALNAFNAYQPVFKEVPTDGEGIIPEELDKILASTPKCKFIYVIPDFQNPTGICWSLERRKKFIEVINKYDLPVFEDNPYGELRYRGESFPTLKSMDTKGLVSFLGTFSKIFCPGLRLGWIAGPHAIVEKFVMIKQSADLHTSNFDQGVADAYMDTYDLDAHVKEIVELYGHRRDLILKTMEEEFPEGVEFTRPDGGLFLWVTVPEGVSARKVFDKCIEQKVAAVIGDAFYPNDKTDRSMRVNYSCMPDDKIVEGVKRMAKAIKECM
ncbi:PLP-dependent aminotransferase family protein [uncultured Succiniclasticum sp.]|jgi:2-aminoadipate transaminase|uniref:aminotransferase-like domain-containing protein n=1 Tax=uncultured Succiniclasticum sp. TaxID=1500547 RepID=UPI0025D86886|nr:PLP-dependent aminotransferase family protein [uncultured Succiniclasticum sp.]MBQ6744282.1 PLP-dependent aminotransferase family protein [Acidaminococcaceae bacterium]